MLTISTVLSFLSAAIILTLLPGPDNLYVITESIINGKRKGLAIAIGLSLGVIVHTIAAALGLSLILQQSEMAFTMVQWIGALYILYLAWLTYQDQGGVPDINATPEVDTIRAVSTGFLMNVLNPKVALFFLALLPQFVDSDGGSYVGQMISLGLIFMLQAMALMSGFALIAGSLRTYIKSPAFWKRARMIKIGVLILFAALILLAGK